MCVNGLDRDRKTLIHPLLNSTSKNCQVHSTILLGHPPFKHLPNENPRYASNWVTVFSAMPIAICHSPTLSLVMKCQWYAGSHWPSSFHAKLHIILLELVQIWSCIQQQFNIQSSSDRYPCCKNDQIHSMSCGSMAERFVCNWMLYFWQANQMVLSQDWITRYWTQTGCLKCSPLRLVSRYNASAGAHNSDL